MTNAETDLKFRVRVRRAISTEVSVAAERWPRAVTKLQVPALREIVSDLGAHRGILLDEPGFQSGALKAAPLTNVQLAS